MHLILFVGIEGNNAKSQEKVVARMNNYQIWKPLKVLPFSISLAFIFFSFELYMEVALDLANTPLKNYDKLSEKFEGGGGELFLF